MIKNLNLNKNLWLITALLSLVVSLISLINQNIYNKFVSQEILPGVISQDLITLIISLILIPFLFYFLWISQLLPLMKSGAKQEFSFSIYILDLVFVLPALIITAVLIIKNKMLGYLLAPVLFFKAFTLLFSVALGSFLRPLYNFSFNIEEGFFYLILSILFLALAVLNFLKLKVSISK